MPSYDLSLIIPARSEKYLAKTIENALENIRGNTEIIAILDGYWPDPPVNDHPRVTVIHHAQSVGQRAGTNEGARLSQAKYIMKVDAHCKFDEGFDVKLMADCEYDWTVVARMYNLHGFDWMCSKCGARWYQGPTPTKCTKCDNVSAFETVDVWERRKGTKTDYARFDRDMHFQYWGDYNRRKGTEDDISDVMCSVGAFFFMHRDRFWELGGMDERHGSWGQFGVEVACKAWLSGGRQVVNKKTWFAHMFRTQPGFGFPYPISGRAQDRAREYSRWLWLGNNWEGQVRPLQWLIDKFAPIPTWS